MTLSADALLDGPRGRHLCLAVAHRLHQPVWSSWLQSAWHPSNPTHRETLVAALSEVDVTPIQDWGVLGGFTGAVADSVDRAMYWQPPDDQDVIAALPDVIDALQPVAEAIASAPGAQWWDTALDLANQRCTSLHDADEGADTPDLSAAGAKLADWTKRTIADEHRAELERPADPAAPYGGYWWSVPTGAGLIRTTRALPGAGSVELFWEEDGFGHEEATIWRMRVRRRPRIYEINEPAAWTSLVERYPLDVSWERRHVWFQVTGRTGSWLIPDWEAVSRDWDAVHLSVTGYLTTATRLLPLDGTTATMLAGFDPDETFWLTDILIPDGHEPEQWAKLEPFGNLETEWQQQPSQS